jgi:hypothetical protein
MINAEQANKIYARLKDKLTEYKGKIVAIEVESGDYFLGENTIDAYNKAVKKYPLKEFFFKRIGFKATYFIGAVGL